jgi:hypothetical protein
MRLALVEKVPDGVYITWMMFGAHTFSFIFAVPMTKLSPSASWDDDVTGTGAAKALMASRLHAMHAKIDRKIFMPAPSF